MVKCNDAYILPSFIMGVLGILSRKLVQKAAPLMAKVVPERAVRSAAQMFLNLIRQSNTPEELSRKIFGNKKIIAAKSQVKNIRDPLAIFNQKKHIISDEFQKAELSAEKRKLLLEWLDMITKGIALPHSSSQPSEVDLHVVDFFRELVADQKGRENYISIIEGVREEVSKLDSLKG